MAKPALSICLFSKVLDLEFLAKLEVIILEGHQFAKTWLIQGLLTK